MPLRGQLKDLPREIRVQRNEQGFRMYCDLRPNRSNLPLRELSDAHYLHTHTYRD